MRKKHQCPAGATVCVKLACSPRICVDILWRLQFPPMSQRCASNVNCVSKLSKSE